MGKSILDMTCGGRSIWFNKNHPECIYFDRREEEFEKSLGKDQSTRHIRVHPDVMGDFRELPFEDNTFSLVVFDPPTLLAIKRASFGLQKHTAVTSPKKKLYKAFQKDSKRVCEC